MGIHSHSQPVTPWSALLATSSSSKVVKLRVSVSGRIEILFLCRHSETSSTVNPSPDFQAPGRVLRQSRSAFPHWVGHVFMEVFQLRRKVGHKQGDTWHVLDLTRLEDPDPRPSALAASLRWLGLFLVFVSVLKFKALLWHICILSGMRWQFQVAAAAAAVSFD